MLYKKLLISQCTAKSAFFSETLTSRDRLASHSDGVAADLAALTGA